jgi:hypothetical protein
MNDAFLPCILSITKASQLCTQRLGHPICFIACPTVEPSLTLIKEFHTKWHTFRGVCIRRITAA